MEDVLISVIMPVYNTKGKYLKQAIESILNQTYTNFEFLIIDDGSNQKTKKVLKKFKDSRIRLIENEENLGLIKTLNKGIDLSNGKYIIRMDSDDISNPERFKWQIDFMEKNPNVGVSGTSYSIFQKRKEDVHPPKSDILIKDTMKKGISALAHPSVIIRREILGDIRYSENFKHCEDLALWIKLMDKTEFANIDEILLKYRWYGGNVSKKHTIEQSLNTQTLIYICMEKFNNQACAEEFRIIRKLKDKKRISTKEFRKLFEKNEIIEPNRMFAKYARKRCINPFVVLGIIK